jgi:hypothetical protein
LLPATPKRLLHDNLVMAARPDFGNRRQRFVNEFAATPISFSVQSQSDCRLIGNDFSAKNPRSRLWNKAARFPR